MITRSQASSRSGFTLVEILVVVGIIAVLIAILLPALSSARGTSEKTAELNSLRQIGMGWSMYSEYSNSRILPGYIAPDVQTAWNVSFPLKYDDTTVPQAQAASYPWRLLPYLDQNHFLIDDYTQLSDSDPRPRLDNIAFEPAFGYNAHYIGGWFEAVEPNGRPVVRFEAANVIARTVTSLRRPSENIIFTSSANRNTGDRFAEVKDNIAGSHFVMPPIVAMSRQWDSEGSNLIVMATTSVPIMRYTHQIAVLNADGHTEGSSPDGLNDQRRWIPIADRADFTHAP
ncbi:MAG: type II secretion system protein [Phycisphaerales bacterium]